MTKGSQKLKSVLEEFNYYIHYIEFHCRERKRKYFELHYRECKSTLMYQSSVNPQQEITSFQEILAIQ
jgi:hypothetical protein